MPLMVVLADVLDLDFRCGCIIQKVQQDIGDRLHLRLPLTTRVYLRVHLLSLLG